MNEAKSHIASGRVEPLVMLRCAACGKEKPSTEMKVCMHHQMHRYVCDLKCMWDFYA